MNALTLHLSFIKLCTHNFLPKKIKYPVWKGKERKEGNRVKKRKAQ